MQNTQTCFLIEIQEAISEGMKQTDVNLAACQALNFTLWQSSKKAVGSYNKHITVYWDLFNV